MHAPRAAEVQADLKEQVQTAARGIPEMADGKGPIRLAGEIQSLRKRCTDRLHHQRYLEQQLRDLEASEARCLSYTEHNPPHFAGCVVTACAWSP